MSDLISRSSVIKEMEKLKQEVNMPVDIVWNNLLKVCIDTVNEQPTAYDVDKVVEELEELLSLFYENNSTTRYEKYCKTKGKCKAVNCFECVIGEAIEIVKGGGVNEGNGSL